MITLSKISVARKALSVVFAAFFVFSVGALAQDDTTLWTTVDPDHKHFDAGESLAYNIHYKWGVINADVCRATMTLDEDTYAADPVIHAKIYGQTAKLYDKFFKVREDLQSYFDPVTLRPVKFTRDSREGNYQLTDHYDFHYEAPEPWIEAVLYTTRKGQFFQKIPITMTTSDLVSAFYRLRNYNFDNVKDGTVFHVPLAIDDDKYTITVKLVCREVRSVKGIGNVPALKFEVQTLAGNVFGEDASAASMWLSDDDMHIPLYFYTKIRVGQVYGTLTSYSGLTGTLKTVE